MSEQTSQEPTMEEILASIRRIISEDDAPASADAQPGDPPQAAAATAAAQPTAAPEPDPEPVDAAALELSDEPDEVLELTERVESHGDIDVYTPAEPAPPEPEPVAAAAAPPLPDPEPISAESLVGATAAAAAASAFSKLSATVAMPAEGRTLEDVGRELLRPMLKQWLDDNLPTIVQAAVNEEVERIARSRVR